jgi:hypothetical protein
MTMQGRHITVHGKVVDKKCLGRAEFITCEVTAADRTGDVKVTGASTRPSQQGLMFCITFERVVREWQRSI